MSRVTQEDLGVQPWKDSAEGPETEMYVRRLSYRCSRGCGEELEGYVRVDRALAELNGVDGVKAFLDAHARQFKVEHLMDEEIDRHLAEKHPA